ncbi:BnaA09g20230D [Brassica napus]|uniref:BnaA09g20230D protein n=1 Tax=Brassica napus TaxID=3708 RepID=A0A078FQA7_BRANA|nr:BnaA09g20230D [Brassica napus]
MSSAKPPKSSRIPVSKVALKITPKSLLAKRCVLINSSSPIGDWDARIYPGTREFVDFNKEGIYGCAGCKTPLYKSTTKFNAGCGWPAFFDGIPCAITRTADLDGRRIEINCAACGGHLGHVFKGEGFATPTDERHCVNSVSLNFTPAEPSL